MKWEITGRCTVSGICGSPFEVILPGRCKPKPLIWLLFPNLYNTMQSDSAQTLQPKKLFKKAKLYGKSLCWFFFYFFILPFTSLNISFCSRITHLKDEVAKMERSAFFLHSLTATKADRAIKRVCQIRPD